MAPGVKAKMERLFIFLIGTVFIVQQLFQIDGLTPVLGGLVFLTIALVLPGLRGMTLWLSIFFVVVGAGLMLLQHKEAAFWLKAASINVTVVTLFIFAPLFGIPVRLPEYVEALKRFYEDSLRSKRALFAGTQLLTQILGVFINVGSIPVVYHIVFVREHPGMTKLLANALNRGFASAIFWSPYFAAMVLVTSSLSVSWSTILPYMLGLSFVCLIVSVAVDHGGLRASREVVLAGEGEAAVAGGRVGLEAPDSKPSRGKSGFPMGLSVYLLSAVVVILVFERLVELPMVLVTCIAAVLFPLLWCLMKGAAATYRQGLVNHATVTLPALKKEITLFLSAGFFSGSISATGFGAYVPKLLEPIPLPISLSFSILTVLLIVGTCMIGLHPIVLVGVLATSIDPAIMQISASYFAILLLGSWAISNTVSPASAVNNLLAGLFNKSVFEMASPNYKFAGWMVLVLVLYLVIIPI
jgi:hypothetical protein